MEDEYSSEHLKTHSYLCVSVEPFLWVCVLVGDILCFVKVTCSSEVPYNRVYFCYVKNINIKGNYKSLTTTYHELDSWSVHCINSIHTEPVAA